MMATRMSFEALRRAQAMRRLMMRKHKPFLMRVILP